jgi:hypothetical protein
MSDAELEMVPEPWGAMYAEAKAAQDNGDNGRVKEIEQAMRAGKSEWFGKISRGRSSKRRDNGRTQGVQ